MLFRSVGSSLTSTSGLGFPGGSLGPWNKLAGFIMGRLLRVFFRDVRGQGELHVRYLIFIVVRY